MSRLPRLRGKQVLAALRRAGFDVIRVRGSHHLLRHPDGRTTVVPVHVGEQISTGADGQDTRGLRDDGGGVR